LCSIQAPLSAFAYPTWIIWITSVRSSSRSKLTYTLRGMALTSHAIMQKSRRMWLDVSLTSADLRTLGVYCKSTWSLSHSKVMCLFDLVIALYSLQWNWARRLLKTHTFMVCVLLMPWAFLSSKWALRPTRFHGHIMAHSQMSYQIVFGCIRCIAPINPANKFGPIPCPMDAFFGN